MAKIEAYWDCPYCGNKAIRGREHACPACGKTMFKLSGKGQKKPFCINPACESFLPEDKRGYRRRTKKSGDDKKETAGRKESAK